MGWPNGWVTDPAIGLSRNDQLRIVGNGVCPQQAAAALRFLIQVAGGAPSYPAAPAAAGAPLLPTPRATDGTDGPVTNCASVQAICDGTAGRNPRLSEMAAGYLLGGDPAPQPPPVELLPTPCVVDRLATGDMTLQEWDDQSRRDQKEKGVGSFGPRGDSLGAAVLRVEEGTVDQRPDYSTTKRRRP
jgi:hypothetical protein